MTTTSSTHQQQRPLTGEELRTIHTRILDASDTRGLLGDTVAAIYTALLSDTGRSLDRLSPDERLNPADHAIPTSQWQSIVGAITRRAQQWGTAATIAMDLINVMPSHYEDPTTAAPDLPVGDYRPVVYTVTVSRDAIDVITACETHLDKLATYYGATSETYLDALHSWHRHLAGVFTRSTGADTHVSKDGALSLYVQTGSGLVYALIWHRVRRYCTTAGCDAVIEDNGIAVAIHNRAVLLDHEHTPSYPVGAPNPGQWSFHS